MIARNVVFSNPETQQNVLIDKKAQVSFEKWRSAFWTATLDGARLHVDAQEAPHGSGIFDSTGFTSLLPALSCFYDPGVRSTPDPRPVPNGYQLVTTSCRMRPARRAAALFRSQAHPMDVHRLLSSENRSFFPKFSITDMPATNL